MRFDAILFDLLTGLIDSWSLWNSVAGREEVGLRWRQAYLRLTYATGAYRPYEQLVTEATRTASLPASAARQLLSRWDELAPWPEAPEVLRRLRAAGLRLGVVTNCSEPLGRRAAASFGVPFEVVVTAERAGAYKPDPRPYRLAIEELGSSPERTLFVAGSPADVPGASAVGMPVAWHNRIGLPLGPSPARPIATLSDLTQLLDEVLRTRPDN